ncbi:unnamed protein product [Calypogeia fissa]
MALRSIIAPFSYSPLLKSSPAIARTTLFPMTAFGTRRGTENIVRCLNCDYRQLVSPTKVSFRGLCGRGQQSGAEFRSIRAKSSSSGQDVAVGEESLGTSLKAERTLILYSKPGCCLCDGLKEKLEGGEISSEIQIEVRDITTNSEWWNLYQYEIPVLARVTSDGIEEPLPRLSPRLSADQVQKKILAHMRSGA